MSGSKRESLSVTARLYYPSDIDWGGERYAESPERQRAREAWRQALVNRERWDAALSRVQAEAKQSDWVRDFTVPFMHPAWRVAVYHEQTPYVSVGCVSVLAPVFFCYGLRTDRREVEA